jgi:dinuclear metal center YbgI/SA1388 family protein
MKGEDIFGYLDRYLDTAGTPDYPGAENGVQVEGRRPVRLVGAAVDASERILLEAEEKGVDLLLVHHGLFWDRERKFTGRRYRKAEILMRSGMAVYGSHLPLDAHPEVGNCAVMVRELGWEPEARFGSWEGLEIGWQVEARLPLDDLISRVESVVQGPVQLLPGGPEEVRRIGLVTGGGGSFIGEAAEAGIDTLITGEGAHHTYLDAMELGVNVLYAGHYATETFGVRALAAHLGERYDIRTVFLDDPSRL